VRHSLPDLKTLHLSVFRPRRGFYAGGISGTAQPLLGGFSRTYDFQSLTIRPAFSRYFLKILDVFPNNDGFVVL
jgi:hypothetical protein